MITIDSRELDKLLNERKKYIEMPKYFGVSDLISGISLAAGLFLGDFSNITFMNIILFKFIVYLIPVSVILWGVFIIIKSITRSYSAQKLYDEICELDIKKEHTFNVLLLKSSQKEGLYLLFDNKRWKSFHFPNCKSITNPYNYKQEIKNMKCLLTEDVGILDSEVLKIEFIGDMIDKKFSVGDGIYKKFHFYFYDIHTNHKFKKFLWKPCCFKYNGKKYKWFTLDQMYKNKNIVKTNKNVVDFVRNRVRSPFIRKQNLRQRHLNQQHFQRRFLWIRGRRKCHHRPCCQREGSNLLYSICRF